MGRPSSANWPQVYQALLYQTSTTYWEMRRPSLCLWTPSVQSPTTPQWPSPTNQAQVYRDLLHQTSITYWEMRSPSPADWPHVYRALLLQTSIIYLTNMDIPSASGPPTGLNLLIEPKCREPYYTKPVSCGDNYKHTQCRWTPHLLSPSVQSPTTPHQYYVWTNTDIVL